MRIESRTQCFGSLNCEFPRVKYFNSDAISKPDIHANRGDERTLFSTLIGAMPPIQSQTSLCRRRETRSDQRRLEFCSKPDYVRLQRLLNFVAWSLLAN